jgi:hypothetical protein
MRNERQPIKDLDKKLLFLQKSPIAQKVCCHGNSQASFSDALGIARGTLRDAISGQRMSEDDQATLGRRCGFDVLWVEWNDTEFKGRDCADNFQKRYIEHHVALRAHSDVIQNDGALLTNLAVPLSSMHNTKPPERVIEPAVTLEQFIAELELSDISSIMIMAVSGRITVSLLLQVLQDTTSELEIEKIHIKILLSASYMSDAGRPASLLETIRQAKEFELRNKFFDVEVRIYSAPAFFRGAIIEHTDGSFSGHLGYYYWGQSKELTQRHHWSRHARVFKKNESLDPGLRVFLSWFNHYWGLNIINTIIFDFDDTIFYTTEAQVGGWAGAIERALAENIIIPS